ncbi:hypothetical protein HHX47_DHR8000479 [Lentinula edodes]|nr:hypothetical protein HHX47_DHR8000479 [Lentinula edodes]
MNSEREDISLPAPLTSKTPLPRYRAASASRRRPKDLKNTLVSSTSSRASSTSGRQNRTQSNNIMEIDSEPGPSNANSTSRNTSNSWDDDSQIYHALSSNPESYAGPYALSMQPPYSPPHSPRHGTWYSPGLGNPESDDDGNRSHAQTYAQTRDASPDNAYNAYAHPLTLTSGDVYGQMGTIHPEDNIHLMNGMSEVGGDAFMQTLATQLSPAYVYDLNLNSASYASQNQSQNRSQASHLSHLLNEESVDPIASRAQSTSQPKGKGKPCAVDDDEAQEERGQHNEEQVKREITEEENEDNAGLSEAPSTPRKGRSSKATGKQKAVPESPPSPQRSSNTSVPPEILAEHSFTTYTCPICFCPPTNATMTPCGHIACGSCLFTAVKTALRRENMMGGPRDDSGGPRCPVCRATISGWDGRGGGVIGLVMQMAPVA